MGGRDAADADTDVRRTLDYASSHRWAINSLPFALLLCAWGLYVLAALDGSALDTRDLKGGWLVTLCGAAWSALAFLTLRRSNKPALSLSVDGIVYWPISEVPIPWTEIQSVGTMPFWVPWRVFSIDVTAIVVSKEFYEQINGSYFGLSEYVVAGPPVKIRVLHYDVGVPFDELREAIVARWAAFSRRPPGQAVPAAGRTAPTALRRTIQALRPKPYVISRLRFWLSLVPVLSIIVLLANHVGLWSTEKQRDAREAAKLEAQARAERQRFDEEMRRKSLERSREMDRMFRRN